MGCSKKSKKMNKKELKQLIKEEILRSSNLSLLSEGVMNINYELEVEERIKHYTEIIEASKLLKGNVLYRGFTYGRMIMGKLSTPGGGVVKITSEEGKGFRGMTKTAQEILSQLGIKNPAFTSFDYHKAKFFGKPHIFIPKQPYTSFQNPNLNDLVAGYASDKIKEKPPIEEIIDGYTKYTNSIPGEISPEVIFDSSEYYLINPQWLNKNLLPRKLKVENIETYSDVTDLLSKVRWITRKKAEDRR